LDRKEALSGPLFILNRMPYLPSMWRRIFLCFALFTALSLLIGCKHLTEPQTAFAPEPEVEIDLDAIRKRGYLLALIDNNSTSYFIYKGRPMGF
jgi:hypothetical protein